MLGWSRVYLSRGSGPLRSIAAIQQSAIAGNAGDPSPDFGCHELAWRMSLTRASCKRPRFEGLRHRFEADTTFANILFGTNGVVDNRSTRIRLFGCFLRPQSRKVSLGVWCVVSKSNRGRCFKLNGASIMRLVHVSSHLQSPACLRS